MPRALTYSLPYPSSLSGPLIVKNRTFISNQSCPVTAPALSCKEKSLIVRSVVEELNASFSVGMDPGVIAERVASAGGTTTAKDYCHAHPPSLILLLPVPVTCRAQYRTYWLKEQSCWSDREKLAPKCKINSCSRKTNPGGKHRRINSSCSRSVWEHQRSLLPGRRHHVACCKVARGGGVAPYGGRRFTLNSLWKTVQIFSF